MHRLGTQFTILNIEDFLRSIRSPLNSICAGKCFRKHTQTQTNLKKKCPRRTNNALLKAAKRVAKIQRKQPKDNVGKCPSVNILPKADMNGSKNQQRSILKLQFKPYHESRTVQHCRLLRGSTVDESKIRLELTGEIAARSTFPICLTETDL